jgi:hypothetical protein
MSEVKVNKISPRTNCGTVQLGDSGDTITIPAGATITNSGTASGFGRTGTVDWQTTTKTSTFTAVNGQGFFVDTSSGAVTANLPSGTAGSIVAFADYTNSFQTNNLTISPNGSQKIGGVASDTIIATEGISLTFLYVDDTEGWKNINDATSNVVGASFISASGGTESTSGDFKIHKFTGPGTFTVSSVATNATQNIVSYVIVGGGGAGGGGAPFTTTAAGGGGAGGFREVKNTDVDSYTASPLNGYSTPANRVTVTAQGYPIVVGGGGTPGIGSGQGASGSNSSFGGITGAGGGGGGGAGGLSGANGGSGGGATCSGSGGTGNTPPVSPAQGQNGSPYPIGGGGGGATQAGQGQDSPFNKNGGTGATSSIDGTPTARAGGGGGGGAGPAGTSTAGGSGGTGGGGAGAPSPGGCHSTAGTVNTGGGGGGGPVSDGTISGAGGSGIVIIRYKFQ